MNDVEVEIFRRPILTSAVTLGALGIGNAPMPVPVCVCKAISVLDQPDHVTILDQLHNTISITHTHAAVPIMIRLADAHIDDIE
jgi:hypothetical protein